MNQGTRCPGMDRMDRTACHLLKPCAPIINCTHRRFSKVCKSRTLVFVWQNRFASAYLLQAFHRSVTMHHGARHVSDLAGRGHWLSHPGLIPRISDKVAELKGEQGVAGHSRG